MTETLPTPDEIRARFEALKMSVVDFAEAAGIPDEKIHTVYRWARGNDVKWRIGHQCWTGLRAIEQARGVR